MIRTIGLVAALLLALPLCGVASSPAQVSGMLGAGFGVAQVMVDPQGSSIGSVGQSGVEAVLRLGPLFGVALDGGYGERSESTKLRSQSFSSKQKTNLRAWFADFLAIVHRPVAGDGFAYIGCGLALAKVKTNWKSDALGGVSDENDYGTSLGFSLGGGAVFPVRGRISAYLKARERLVTGESTRDGTDEMGDPAEWVNRVPMGGPEIGVGLGVRF